MPSIIPRGGWDEPDPQQLQGEVHPALRPRDAQPLQPANQPTVQNFYIAQPPPPTYVTQTVVVQNSQSSSGCLWVLLLLLFPLWPITIPIAIIVWLCNRSNNSVTSIGSYGAPVQPLQPSSPPTDNTSTVVVTVIVVAIVLLLSYIYFQSK